MNMVTETHDLSLYDRFDANTGVMKAQIGSTGITIQDATGTFLPGTKFAVYVSKDGRVLLLKEDPEGYEIKATGRGGAGRLLPCETAAQAVQERTGFDGRRKLEMRYSGEEGLYIIKLPKNRTLDDHPAAVSRGGEGTHELS